MLIQEEVQIGAFGEHTLVSFSGLNKEIHQDTLTLRQVSTEAHHLHTCFDVKKSDFQVITLLTE